MLLFWRGNTITFVHRGLQNQQNSSIKVPGSCFQKSEKEFLDPSLHLDRHQKLMGSILGRDPSAIQVSSKSV